MLLQKRKKKASKPAPALGELIDKMYEHDQRIDEAQAVVRKLNAVRAKIEERLLEAMRVAKVKSSKGELGLAMIRSTQHPKIKDSYALWRYITKKKAYDLMQNRVASKAYFDRVEDGEEVPGVEVYTSTKISLTKAK